MIISCDMIENKETKTIEEKEGVQVYELGFHIISSLNEEKMESALDTLRKEVTGHGGSLITEGSAELVDLAYTMTVNEGGKHTKYDTAYFGWIKFEMEPARAAELQREVLDADKNILRYILIKTLREETRAQMREETLQTLEEIKTTGTIAKKQVDDKDKIGEEVSDKELDKAVEDLVGDESTDDAKKVESVDK